MFLWALTLVVFWLLGCISSFTCSGLIHAFPIVATGMLLPRIVLGRKAEQ
jgi:hypothetical protein